MLANPSETVNSFTTINFPDESESSSTYRLLSYLILIYWLQLRVERNYGLEAKVDDDAVLCTENQTFRLRELVTSNMFLVVEKSFSESGAAAGLVVGRPQATLEATAMTRPPGIDQLLKALNDSLYNGGVDEDDFKGNDDIHVTKIYENIQASSKEIEQCLKTTRSYGYQWYRLYGTDLLY